MRSSCSCAAPPSARSAPCTRRPHYHRASWPFRLLDGERKNVQPFFHRHDRRLHSGQTSSRRHTGNSGHCNQDVSVYPFWLRLKLKSLAGQLNPGIPPMKLLTKAPTFIETAPSLSCPCAATRRKAWAFLSISRPRAGSSMWGTVWTTNEATKTASASRSSCSDSDNDPAMADQIVSTLSQFHQMVPALAILPALGRSAYKKFLPAGPLSAQSPQGISACLPTALFVRGRVFSLTQRR